jgi:ABC-type transporter Mla subunit MlaD
MTDEEMERAIEFLVKNQASFDVRLEQTNEQIAETGRQLGIYAETQSQFIQIVTESMTKLADAQARTDNKISELSQKIAEVNARCNEQIAESNARLNEKIADTNARLDRLAATVERNITGGNGAS